MLRRGTQIPGAWSPVRIIFFTEVPNIVSPIWNFLYITLLGPRILKWFSYSWKMFAPLAQMLCINGDVK